MPYYLVFRADRTLHFCIHYEKPNFNCSITAINPISSLSVLIAFVTQRSYVQLTVTANTIEDKPFRENRKSSACASHHGLILFICMPPFLENPPAILQQTVNISFEDVESHFAAVYLIKLVLFLPMPDEHNEHLNRIRGLYTDAVRTLRLKNMVSLQNQWSNETTQIVLRAPRRNVSNHRRIL